MEDRGCSDRNCPVAVWRHQEWKRQEIEAAKSDFRTGMVLGMFCLLVALAFLIIPKIPWELKAISSGAFALPSALLFFLAYEGWKKKKELQKG
jgi:hypothetical protein